MAFIDSCCRGANMIIMTYYYNVYQEWTLSCDRIKMLL
jgi:hypothetical protein